MIILIKKYHYWGKIFKNDQYKSQEFTATIYFYHIEMSYLPTIRSRCFDKYFLHNAQHKQ